MTTTTKKKGRKGRKKKRKQNIKNQFLFSSLPGCSNNISGTGSTKQETTTRDCNQNT